MVFTYSGFVSLTVRVWAVENCCVLGLVSHFSHWLKYNDTILCFLAGDQCSTKTELSLDLIQIPYLGCDVGSHISHKALWGSNSYVKIYICLLIFQNSNYVIIHSWYDIRSEIYC